MISKSAFLETTNTERQIKIDQEDFEKVNKHFWYEDQNGYARTNIIIGSGKTRSIRNIKLHQLVKPNKSGWSFADGNKLNCCKENLIDYKRNGSGRQDISKHGKGIFKKGNRYNVQYYNNVTKSRDYLGTFATLIEAQLALDKHKLSLLEGK